MLFIMYIIIILIIVIILLILSLIVIILLILLFVNDDLGGGRVNPNHYNKVYGLDNLWKYSTHIKISGLFIQLFIISNIIGGIFILII